MSLRSEYHHGNVAVSASGRQVVTTTPERSGGEVSGYKEVLKQHESVKKCLDRISENARNKVWMSPDLLIYSNSEYVYATSPNRSCPVLGQGRESNLSIKTIVCNFYNTLALSKYNGFE